MDRGQYYSEGRDLIWVIVASLEAMPCNSLTINSYRSQINQFQSPSEPRIHSVIEIDLVHLVIEVDLANTATLTLHVPTILHTGKNN